MAYPGPARPRHPKRVVVLDFFRTDCKPCRNGLPKLVKLHKKLRSRGVQVVLVALLEDEEGEAKLDRFLARYPLPFPVLVDAYSNVARKYVATGDSVQIPALFVIDRNGVLRSRVGGVVDSKVLEKLQARIEELLK
jgi:peroxiredoxin